MDTSELLVDFLNTVDLETGTDQLDDDAGWTRWCTRRGLVAGPRTRARQLRDGLRTLVAGEQWADAPTLTVPVHPAAGGVLLGGSDALDAVLAAATTLTATGCWSRLKLCPADDCLEAFYDRSRNRSRIWCDMAGCGNRAKLRSYRTRHA
ncbi:CGNR zinc finger domain-containing protein [Cellulomonas citrea]|uniref:CGNR zinc finger domain-containing protein n=1 Tax=Cellulomonas citrea TaxID=1909423 RepID=UPI00135AF354|nr:CGNR zinc finger domain-containing protein [Cellulomonas citrea]